MKKNIINRATAFFTFALSIHMISAYSCPTCVGRLTKESPAFFAQDYTQQNSSVQTKSSSLDTAFSWPVEAESHASPATISTQQAQQKDSGTHAPQENN